MAKDLMPTMQGLEEIEASAVQDTAPEIWNPGLFNSIIQALVGALELKDSYTQGQLAGSLNTA